MNKGNACHPITYKAPVEGASTVAFFKGLALMEAIHFYGLYHPDAVVVVVPGKAFAARYRCDHRHKLVGIFKKIPPTERSQAQILMRFS